MSIQTLMIFVVFALLAGTVGGYYFRLLLSLQKKESIDLDVKKKTFEAKEKAKEIIEKGEEKAKEHEEAANKKIQKRENSVEEKEERLVKKEAMLDERQMNQDRNEETLKEKTTEIKHLEKENETERKNIVENLARIADLSKEEAKNELFQKLEKENESDVITRIRKLENTAKERLEKRAQDILVSSIHRLGNAISADVLSIAVEIPDENVKGKIIGKEGRNIRSFEKTAGVELVIDDTPGQITVSAFDPVRRHVAKVALEKLIEDGRIQPAKIEERIASTQEEIDKTIKEKGEEALYECQIFDLDEQVVTILGRLHFRTSYGQNVLQHSIETAHLAGMIAAELGADVRIAKAGGLVHDIGKAVDHSMPGSHVEIGRRILQKFNTEKEIIQAMQSHHEEYPYETPESIIVQVADSISASRPGARRDSLENYLQRLQDLETLVNSFGNVTRCYALQAGREVRVFVEPDDLTDLEAQKLARELALSIEEELQYPGEIKISVMREARYIEYAR